MKEHSDLAEHQVIEKKAVARFTESGEIAFQGKYDNHKVKFLDFQLYRTSCPNLQKRKYRT